MIEQCEFAERPFSRLNPGFCGEPATHVVFSASDGGKPFRCCEKHFYAMIDSPPLTAAKAEEILNEARAEIEAEQEQK